MYKFPVIHTINDVLPAIKNKEEFIIADRDEFVVINYVVSKEDTFENPDEIGISKQESLYRAIRRECRGIIFDKSGYIISRPLNKFFNVNEKEETHYKNIDLSLPHSLLPKLDGSFIRPIRLSDSIHYATKMGLTDIGENSEKFAKQNPAYDKFSLWCYENNFTPIFEWISPKNRIVVFYPKDNLILLALRDNITGEYQINFQEVARKFDIPTIETINNSKGSITQLIEIIRSETGIEGYVLRFDDGFQVKIKCEEYCSFHRSKDISSSEHVLIQLIIDNKIDDLKSLLMQEDIIRVNDLENEFWKAVDKNCLKYTQLVEHAYEESSGDKKKFAIEHSKKYNKQDVSFIFSCWDNIDNVRDNYLTYVRKNASKEQRYETFKKSLFE